MDGDDCETFGAFGLRKEVKREKVATQTQKALWAKALVDQIFIDPECEHLQVASIISAIKDVGFPYHDKILELEQQLDPNNEGFPVDKITLNKVLEHWLISCDKDKDDEASYEIDDMRCRVALHNTQPSSIANAHLGDGDNYKNEICSLYAAVNAQEDEVKTLLLENNDLKKSLKHLQLTLQQAIEAKVTAEESKTTAEECLQIEISKRNKEENKVMLLNEQLKNLEGEKNELSAYLEDTKCKVNDLCDKLVIKCDLQQELVQESDSLKTCLEELHARKNLLEKENRLLANSNLELTELANESKKTIQDLKEEKDLLSKKLLVISSQVKKGEIVTNNSSDLESDSPNIGDVSFFTPQCFSSPLPAKNLGLELTESVVHGTTVELLWEMERLSSSHVAERVVREAPVELTPKALRFPSGVSSPTSNLAEQPGGSAHEQKHVRKRKRFGAAAVKTSTATKRLRSEKEVPSSTVALYRAPALPLEHPTSFAINLTTRQKLLEGLRQTLRIRPDFRGCILEFVRLYAGDLAVSTKLLREELPPLIHAYCATRLRMPFRERQFLSAICEESPSQSSSAAAFQSENSNEFRSDIFANDAAVTFQDFTSVTNQHGCVFESESNACTVAKSVKHEPKISDDNAQEAEDSEEAVTFQDFTSVTNQHGCVFESESNACTVAKSVKHEPKISDDNAQEAEDSEEADCEIRQNLDAEVLLFDVQSQQSSISEPEHSSSSSATNVYFHTCRCLLVEPSDHALAGGRNAADEASIIAQVSRQDLQLHEPVKDVPSTERMPRRSVQRRWSPSCVIMSAVMLLVFCLWAFSFYIFLTKIFLTDVEYQNFLESLGAKYQRHGSPPY